MCFIVRFSHCDDEFSTGIPWEESLNKGLSITGWLVGVYVGIVLIVNWHGKTHPQCEQHFLVTAHLKETGRRQAFPSLLSSSTLLLPPIALFILESSSSGFPHKTFRRLKMSGSLGMSQAFRIRFGLLRHTALCTEQLLDFTLSGRRQPLLNYSSCTV